MNHRPPTPVRSRRTTTLTIVTAALALTAASCSESTSSLRPAPTLPPLDTTQLTEPSALPMETLDPIDPIDPIDPNTEWTLPTFVNPGAPIPRPPSRARTTPPPTKPTAKPKPKPTAKPPTKPTAKPKPKPTAKPKPKPPAKTTVKPPAKTTAPKPSTTVPKLQEMVSARGIGTSPLGEAYNVLIPKLSATFGEPTEVVEQGFPDPNPGGGFTDGTTKFAYPSLQKNCYANGLCVYFGGKTTDPATFKFVGWEQTTPGGLTTRSGYTVGTTLAVLAPVTNVKPGPCPNRAIATSKNNPFVTFEMLAEEGTFYTDDPAVPTDPQPDPNKVVATRMYGGAVTNPVTPTC